MSTAAAPEPRPGRPNLSVISTCDACMRRVVDVADRFGKPQTMDCGEDGRAVRDPNGEWWAAKVGGTWCVVRLQPHEEPPTSGCGIRYRAHSCKVTAEDLAVSRLGGEVVPIGGSADAGWGVTAGPCAGMCGIAVPRRFGPNPQIMCQPCAETLAVWRRAPSGPIPFGKWVGGVYTPRS